MSETTGFGLLIIGSELLTGKRQDAHLDFAIGALSKRGLELDRVEYLGDDPQRLSATLNRSMEQHDIVFVFGGIGATPDDHTRQCAADAAGLQLLRHPEAAAIIEDRFGESAYPQRIHMAHLPQGSILIPNPVNQIAGFSVGHHHFIPGFPQMAWPMLEWVLDTHYPHLHHQSVISEHILTLPNVSEGQLIELLQSFVKRYPHLNLSCLPHMQGEYRETELGVSGDADQVSVASAWLGEQLDQLGFHWTKGGR
jgi:molybdopterin-biosynthesis enzyme MoeA-like protein